MSAKEWKSVEAEAFPLPTEENTYTGTGMISHLKPATVYLARVSSRNAYGFSKPSQAFKFATRGAGKNYSTPKVIYISTLNKVGSLEQIYN